VRGSAALQEATSGKRLRVTRESVPARKRNRVVKCIADSCWVDLMGLVGLLKEV
jgi:hypothetical protein